MLYITRDGPLARMPPWPTHLADPWDEVCSQTVLASAIFSESCPILPPGCEPQLVLSQEKRHKRNSGENKGRRFLRGRPLTTPCSRVELKGGGNPLLTLVTLITIFISLLPLSSYVLPQLFKIDKSISQKHKMDVCQSAQSQLGVGHSWLGHKPQMKPKENINSVLSHMPAASFPPFPALPNVDLLQSLTKK